MRGRVDALGTVRHRVRLSYGCYGLRSDRVTPLSCAAQAGGKRFCVVCACAHACVLSRVFVGSWTRSSRSWPHCRRSHGHPSLRWSHHARWASVKPPFTARLACLAPAAQSAFALPTVTPNHRPMVFGDEQVPAAARFCKDDPRSPTVLEVPRASETSGESAGPR